MAISHRGKQRKRMNHRRAAALAAAEAASATTRTAKISALKEQIKHMRSEVSSFQSQLKKDSKPLDEAEPALRTRSIRLRTRDVVMYNHEVKTRKGSGEERSRVARIVETKATIRKKEEVVEDLLLQVKRLKGMSNQEFVEKKARKGKGAWVKKEGNIKEREKVKQEGKIKEEEIEYEVAEVAIKQEPSDSDDSDDTDSEDDSDTETPVMFRSRGNGYSAYLPDRPFNTEEPEPDTSSDGDNVNATTILDAVFPEDDDNFVPDLDVDLEDSDDEELEGEDSDGDMDIKMEDLSEDDSGQRAGTIYIKPEPELE